MTKLKINPEYEVLCTSLTPEEHERLKDSIRKNGLWVPIIVNPDSVVLDGNNRFRICNELGIEPKFVVRDFGGDTLLEKLFVLEVNTDRRHLTKMQRVELGLKKIEILRKISEQHQRSTIPRKGQKGFQPLSTSNVVNIKHTKEEIAKAASVSIKTMERAKKVLEEAPEELIRWVKEGDLSVSRAHRMINGPVSKKKIETILEKAPKEIKEKLRKGKISLTYAYQTLNRRQKHANPPSLPEGKFDILYVDPPWDYDLVATDGNPETHYPLASQEDICNLEVDGVSIHEKIADNAVLFLWATNPKIREALELIEAWGFDYKTNMVWVKDLPRLGFNFRGQHELLLLAKKGDMPSPTTENRPSSVLNAPITRHSEKPTVVYEMIEKMYPNRKYLELFARKTRENWETWGNEVEE